MTRVVVGLGSNVDRESNITASLDELAQNFSQLKISPVYESSPKIKKNINLDFLEEQPSYFNMVVSFETDYSGQRVREILKAIEDKQSRIRNSVLVTIDLDILLYDDFVGDLKGGAVPHEDIIYCAYVLRPLFDLFPEEKHPVVNATYKKLWLEFDNKAEIRSVDFIWRDELVSVASPANFL